jgi:hypothetical protein
MNLSSIFQGEKKFKIKKKKIERKQTIEIDDQKLKNKVISQMINKFEQKKN